jgi:hypothetical protein
MWLYVEGLIASSVRDDMGNKAVVVMSTTVILGLWLIVIVSTTPGLQPLVVLVRPEFVDDVLCDGEERQLVVLAGQVP